MYVPINKYRKNAPLHLFAHYFECCAQVLQYIYDDSRWFLEECWVQSIDFCIACLKASWVIIVKLRELIWHSKAYRATIALVVLACFLHCYKTLLLNLLAAILQTVLIMILLLHLQAFTSWTIHHYHLIAGSTFPLQKRERTICPLFPFSDALQQQQQRWQCTKENLQRLC